MHFRGYAESTLKGISKKLRQLGRNADLKNAEAVLKYIHARAAYKIIELQGRTYYAIGLGLTRIVESITRDENAILTVSSLLQDYFGVSDICLSVTTIVNRNGVSEVLKLPLEEEEIKQFQNPASIVKNITQSLDL